DRARRQLRAGRLIRTAVDGLAGSRGLRPAASLESACRSRRKRAARPKAATRFATRRAGAEVAPAVGAARGFRREGPLQPLAEILAIVAPHHFVSDAVGELADPRLQRRAPFRGGEGAALDFARPDHVGEAARRRYHLLDRDPPAAAREIVRVLLLRQQREAKTLAGIEMGQRQIGGAPSRL